MQGLTETIITTLSQLTVLGDGLLVIGFLLLVLRPKTKGAEIVMKFVKEKALWMAYGVALLATVGSLYFSEGAGFEPCKLCWFQRIFMYPLPIVLLVAALKRDTKVAVYVLSLSLVGLVIAMYHYYVQLSGVEILPCSVVGYSVSCTKDFFLRYGYITIPVMSATAFGLISMLMAMVMRKK